MVRYEESLALAQELGDQIGIAMALGEQGVITAYQRDWRAAMSLFEKSLDLSRRLNDRWYSALTLLHMMGTRRGGPPPGHKDWEQSVRRGEEALAIFRALSTKRWTAVALFVTGHALRLQGDPDQATARYRESLASFDEVGDSWIATECITGLGLIDSARGSGQRAARLLGAAEAAREELGITHRATRAGDQERFWTTLRERPAETAFAAAWAEGRAMTLEQAVNYALTSVEPAEPAGRWQHGKRPTDDPLTDREREVVRLVTRGLTNREIATTLVVSGRTADAHVQNVLNKLGFRTRAQIAAWAVERGLTADQDAETSAPSALPTKASRAT